MILSELLVLCNLIQPMHQIDNIMNKRLKNSILIKMILIENYEQVEQKELQV